MCCFLAPLSGWWPQCLLSSQLMAQRPENWAPQSHPTPRPTFLELCIWWSTGPPVLLRDVEALPSALYTQTREVSHVKGSQAEGNFGCGQPSLQPHKAEAALQDAQATKGRLLHPTKCLFSLMRKTLLFSHQNTWFWLIFTGLCMICLCHL